MSKAKANLQPTSDKLDFQNLIRLLELTHQHAQSQANRAINRALVVRNWLFGWYIVEFEQNGVDRAEYGKETLKRISATLQASVGKGFSVQNLELMRRFFNGFVRIRELGEKSQTLSGIFETENRQTPSVDSSNMGVISQISETLSRKLAEAFSLSWSGLIRIIEHRSFVYILKKRSNTKIRLPSPPVLRGRRAGDEGVEYAKYVADCEQTCPILDPSPPTPLPRVQGRGEVNKSYPTTAIFSPASISFTCRPNLNYKPNWRALQPSWKPVASCERSVTNE